MDINNMINNNPHFFGTLFQSNNGLSMFLYPSQDKTNIYFEIFFQIEYDLAFNMNITQVGSHVSPFNLNIVKASNEGCLSIEGSPKNINAIEMTASIVDQATILYVILKIEGTIEVPWTTIARMNLSQWIAISGNDKSLLEGLVAVSNIQDATSFMFFEITRATELKSGNFSVVIPLDDKSADGIHPGNFFVTSHLTNKRYELDVFMVSGEDEAKCGWRVSVSNLWSDSTHSGIYFSNGWMQPVQQEYFIGHNGLTEEQCSFVPFLDILDITNYFNSSNPQCEAY